MCLIWFKFLIHKELLVHGRNLKFKLIPHEHFLLIILLFYSMSSPGEIYSKEMSEVFTSTPDQVQFHQDKYIVQKTWKIGVKKDCDYSRKEFIQELEKVNMSDVNQYKVNFLKSKVRTFVLENDLPQFHGIVDHLRKLVFILQNNSSLDPNI